MIEFKGTGFTYDGERFVLDGVDARIERGEFVCVLGGNGSGKSTLAKHVNALLVPDEGGQKQRVAIAGVLAMEPAILILDEATAMLDPRGRKGLMRVCRELHDRGMTVVMITHFMEEAAQADRVIVLEDGHVACDGAPQDVLVQAELLERLNLDLPFAAELSLELGRRGVPVGMHIETTTLKEELCRLLSKA